VVFFAASKHIRKNESAPTTTAATAHPSAQPSPEVRCECPGQASAAQRHIWQRQPLPEPVLARCYRAVPPDGRRQRTAPPPADATRILQIGGYSSRTPIVRFNTRYASTAFKVIVKNVATAAPVIPSTGIKVRSSRMFAAATTVATLNDSFGRSGTTISLLIVRLIARDKPLVGNEKFI